MQTAGDGASDMASVQGSSTIESENIWRRLEPMLSDKRAKVDLAQSRDKLDMYRKELDGDTVRSGEKMQKHRQST